MKKLIAIAFFAISVVTSSAQTTNTKYQEISFAKFQELKDSLNSDTLLEFEVLTFDYIGRDGATIDTAISDLKKHNWPDTNKPSLYVGNAKFSSSDDTVHLLDTTYVCITTNDELGMISVTLNVITSRLNVTWVDESIK